MASDFLKPPDSHPWAFDLIVVCLAKPVKPERSLPTLSAAESAKFFTPAPFDTGIFTT
jgi:hypothetical protein